MKWYLKVILVLFLLYILYTILHIFFMGDIIAMIFVFVLIGMALVIIWLDTNDFFTDDEVYEIK